MGIEIDTEVPVWKYMQIHTSMLCAVLTVDDLVQNDSVCNII